jgi:trans-aconitate methyltransferase
MGPGSEPPGTNWDAGLYDARHAFVWRHGASLVELLAPQPGERVLDLGCGTGHLTARIAAAGAEVVGLDSSPEMLEQARAAYPQLTFVPGDARDFAFDRPFDATFSNAVLHWVGEPGRVAACVRRALRPGGRFVAEFGGRGNVRGVVAALRAAAQRLGIAVEAPAWYYPSVGEYASVLESSGLEPVSAVLFDRPTPLEGEGGLRNWLRMFCGGPLESVPEERREGFLRAVEEAARPTLFRDGTWVADYRRLRVVAVRTP